MAKKTPADSEKVVEPEQATQQPRNALDNGSGAKAQRPRVRSMSDQVTDTLREMILLGELQPEQQVTHEWIAEELDVSTMPVREALLRLTTEGFIEGGTKSRSFRVATLTLADIEDIYWIHAQLTGELAARAALRMPEEKIEELRRTHEDWLAAESQKDMMALERANNQFHKLVNLGADSPKMLHFLRRTLLYIPQNFYSMIPPEQVTVVTAAHEELLRAIQARDGEAARRAANAHTQNSGVDIARHFDKRGYWTVPMQREMIARPGW